MIPTVRKILVVLAFVAFAGQAALADNAYPTIDLLKTSKTVVGEDIVYPEGKAQISASIVTVAPGAETIWHRHGVPMYAYILEGALDVDYGSHGVKTYKQGDSLIEAMNVTHRGVNKGPAVVRILAVYMGSDKAANVILEKK